MSVVSNSSQENSCCKRVSNIIQKHGVKMFAVALIVAQVAVLSYFSLYYGAASAALWLALSGVGGLISLKKRSIKEKTLQQKQVAQQLPKAAETSPEVKPVDKRFAKCIKPEQLSEAERRVQAEARKKARQGARLDLVMDQAADSEAAG